MLLGVSTWGSFGDLTVSYFVTYRFIGNIIGDIGAWFFDGLYGLGFARNYTIFDIGARFGIFLYKVNCGFTWGLDGFYDIFDFFVDYLFPVGASFKVTFAIDGAYRYGVRAGLDTFTIGIFTGAFGGSNVGALYGTCGILDDPDFFNDLLLRLEYQDVTSKTFIKDEIAFIDVATSGACVFFRFRFLRGWVFILRFLRVPWTAWAIISNMGPVYSRDFFG